jgi:hypothetical protein
MAVEDACLWDILFLLRRHFREILTTRYAARPELSAGDLVSLSSSPISGFILCLLCHGRVNSTDFRLTEMLDEDVHDDVSTNIRRHFPGRIFEVFTYRASKTQ